MLPGSHQLLSPRAWHAHAPAWTQRSSGLFVFAALCACYAETLLILASQWYTNQTYSYAFVVPPISAFVAITTLKRGPVPHAAPDYLLGGAVVLGSTLMFVVGQVGAILALQEIALAVAVAGTVLLFGGPAMLRRLWFPVAYLLLMVPVWDAPLDVLHTSSQQMSARLATAILHFFEIPALRTETFIVLPSITLEVARECSGINQLIAVLAVAAPASYLMIRGNLRRIAIVVFALVVALVSNGVRIAAIGLWVNSGWAPNEIHGPYHILQGLAVSFVGFAVIAVSLMFAANRRIDERITATPAGASSLLSPQRPTVEFLLGAIVVAAATAPLWFTPIQVPLTAGFDQFPKQIGSWSETWTDPARLSQVRVAGADDELVRTYRSDDGSRILLYVGYFRSQEQQREIVGTSTQPLVDAASPVNFDLPSGPGPLRVSRVTQPAGTNQTFFWFDINGRLVTAPYQAKYHSVVDALLRRRTNGAVVIVSWDTPGGTNAERASEPVAFLSMVMPLLRSFIPS